MSFAVSPQINPIARAHLSKLWLHAIEVSGHEQIGLSVTVNIGG
jgi:hypothetical protein